MSKKNYVEILFPDNKIYRYNRYDSYEKKIENINIVIKHWGKYFNDNWDKYLIIGGKPQRPAQKILDQLAYYLLYDSDKELTDRGILNNYKHRMIKETEIPVSACSQNVQDLFYSIDSDNEEFHYDDSIYKEYYTSDLDKRFKRFNHLKNINDDFIEHIRFSTIRGLESYSKHTPMGKVKNINKNLCLCIKEKYYIKDNDKIVKELLKHYDKLIKNFDIKTDSIKDKNKVFSYAKKSYKNILTQFEKITLLKEYRIPSSVPGKWATVYDDLTFTFDGVQRQIKGIYEFDKILCYKLDNKILFFNPEIEQVKDFSKKI